MLVYVIMVCNSQRALKSLFGVKKHHGIPMRNIEYDDNGNLTSFEWQQKKCNGTRYVKSRLSIDKEKRMHGGQMVFLDEKQFFAKLKTCYKDATDIKIHGGKIYKFNHDGFKYETDKSEMVKVFDYVDYKEFLKVCRHRFYRRHDLLRNGYFSGMIGTNDAGIREYKANKKNYDIYDVDFNSAYPSSFSGMLPFGNFYENEDDVKADNKMKFYEIRFHGISNESGVYIPPAPYKNLRDFDFLVSKRKRHMIVSELRLELIDKIYSKHCYKIIKTYYCAAKRNMYFYERSKEIYDDIIKYKKSGDRKNEAKLKIVINSIVGQFGRRDEHKEIESITLNDKGVFVLNWTEPKPIQQNNYLPLAMYINDACAVRLYNLLTQENVLRICHNTDGGVIAVRKGSKLLNETNFGGIKSKPIIEPEFYYSTMLYNRPLIYDKAQDKCFNTKSIRRSSDRNCFVLDMEQRINTTNGFKIIDTELFVMTEPYKYFDLRRNEFGIILDDIKNSNWARNIGNDILRREKLNDFIQDMRLGFYNYLREIDKPSPIIRQMGFFENTTIYCGLDKIKPQYKVRKNC